MVMAFALLLLFREYEIRDDIFYTTKLHLLAWSSRDDAFLIPKNRIIYNPP